MVLMLGSKMEVLASRGFVALFYSALRLTEQMCFTAVFQSKESAVEC